MDSTTSVLKNNPFKKLKEFFSSPSHSRTLALMGILLLVGAIGLTATVVQQQTNTKQHAAGNSCTAVQGICYNAMKSCPSGYQVSSNATQNNDCQNSTVVGDLQCCVPKAGTCVTSYKATCTGAPNFTAYNHQITTCNGVVTKDIIISSYNNQPQCGYAPTITPTPDLASLAEYKSSTCTNGSICVPVTSGTSQNPKDACKIEPRSSNDFVYQSFIESNYVYGSGGFFGNAPGCGNTTARVCCDKNLHPSPQAPTPPPPVFDCAKKNQYTITQGWGQGSCTSLSSICVLTGKPIPQGFVDGNAGCNVNIQNSQSLGFPRFATSGECWNYKNPYGGSNNIWAHDQLGTKGSCTDPGSICWNSLPDRPTGYTQANPGVNCLNGATPGECFNYTGTNLCISGGSTASNPSGTTPGGSQNPPATPTLSPTPIPQPYLNLSVTMSGIGTVPGNNNSPLHTTRTVYVKVFNAADNVITGTPVIATKGTLTYDNTTGKFTNAHLGLGKGLTSGQYQILIKLDQTLGALVTTGQNNLFTLSNNNTATLPTTTLFLGDFVADNKLDLLDYNAGVSSCYGSLADTATCAIGKQQADLNDDGAIDGIDYNILLRSLNSFADPSNANGQGPLNSWH